MVASAQCAGRDMTQLPDDAALDRARFEADPVADAAIERLLAPCWRDAVDVDLPMASALTPLQRRVAEINAAVSSWCTNADVAHWQAPAGTPEAVAEVLGEYLLQTQALPSWARPELIERAEALFFEEGALSCLLLFCASLPECYVVPDLAEVLHTTGQLEARTEHRIRATAAMIFPVMMRGGLVSPTGSGRAQVLKVRLIHAMVRHLILRGAPAGARSRGLQPMAFKELALDPSQSFVASLVGRGWPDRALGLPCNQEELAYTLLTFGYVILRGLHSLGVPHRPADEAAVLHAWNVMGALVGVQPGLMAHGMDDAQALFALLQQRGRRQSSVAPDPRGPLGRALMACMARVIPWRVAKPWPVLMTRRLCGSRSAADIGLGKEFPVPLSSRWTFAAALMLARGLDGFGRWFRPDFSLSRMVGRVLGYHLLSGLLMDQTRPLRLPDGVLQQMHGTVGAWGHDVRAPAWVNALEDQFTVSGAWHATRT